MALNKTELLIKSHILHINFHPQTKCGPDPIGTVQYNAAYNLRNVWKHKTITISKLTTSCMHCNSNKLMFYQMAECIVMQSMLYWQPTDSSFLTPKIMLKVQCSHSQQKRQNGDTANDHEWWPWVTLITLPVPILGTCEAKLVFTSST